MSFSNEVKKELLSLTNSECCQKAFISGLLQGSSEISLISSGMKLTVKSPLPGMLRQIIPYIKSTYRVEPTLVVTEKLDINKQKIYYLELEERVKDIIKDFRLLPLETISSDDFTDECCQRSFVRGYFIARGSISDPKKRTYHFEITCKQIEVAEIIRDYFAVSDLIVKIIPKRNQFLLYSKRAETISDILAFLGASSGVYYFEDSRIFRDMENSVNRVLNCDVANLQKMHLYATKQLEAISFFEKHHIVDKLTPRLRDAITLRKEFPDVPLQELSEYSEQVIGKKLSKSGISHCFRELAEIYDEYQQAKIKKESPK